MFKYLFILVLFYLFSSFALAQNSVGFEEELRFLETQERIQEDNQIKSIEKMTNTVSEDIQEDSVTHNLSGTKKKDITEQLTPDSETIPQILPKKTRRIPSR